MKTFPEDSSRLSLDDASSQEAMSYYDPSASTQLLKPEHNLARPRFHIRFVVARVALCVSLLINISLLGICLRAAQHDSNQRASHQYFATRVYCMTPISPIFTLEKPTDESTSSLMLPPAPVQDSVRTIDRRFPHVLDTNIYMQHPSEEVDQAWRDLYECTPFSCHFHLTYRQTSYGG